MLRRVCVCRGANELVKDPLVVGENVDDVRPAGCDLVVYLAGRC